ncbi:hypothetical protein OAR13_00095 [Gammaproteobacteria bacterium]|nr:hypothetical protein [Gammaproteobacteria bacterium]
MEYVVEGKAYWAFLKEAKQDARPYQLLVVPSDPVLQKYKDQGYRTNDFSVSSTETIEGIRIAKQHKYGAPPVYDKNQKRIYLDQEIPNGTKVKVKFDTWKVDDEKYGKIKGTRLLAVMLLEDLPLPFDRVESFASKDKESFEGDQIQSFENHETIGSKIFKLWDKYGSAIIVLIFAYFVYTYLANLNNEREQRMGLFEQCIEENNIKLIGTETMDEMLARFKEGDNLTKQELETLFSQKQLEAYDDNLSRYFLEVQEKCGEVGDL